MFYLSKCHGWMDQLSQMVVVREIKDGGYLNRIEVLGIKP